MFVACQNTACADYQKAKTVPELSAQEITEMFCGVCGLADYIQVDGPAAPEPPLAPPELTAPDLDASQVSATSTLSYIEVTHNGQKYALALTPLPPGA